MGWSTRVAAIVPYVAGVERWLRRCLWRVFGLLKDQST